MFMQARFANPENAICAWLMVLSLCMKCAETLAVNAGVDHFSPSTFCPSGQAAHGATGCTSFSCPAGFTEMTRQSWMLNSTNSPLPHGVATHAWALACEAMNDS